MKTQIQISNYTGRLKTLVEAHLSYDDAVEPPKREVQHFLALRPGAHHTRHNPKRSFVIAPQKINLNVLPRRSNSHTQAQGPQKKCGKKSWRNGSTRGRSHMPSTKHTAQHPQVTEAYGPSSENYHGKPRRPENWGEKDKFSGGGNERIRTRGFSRLPSELCPTVFDRLGCENDEQNGDRLESPWYMQVELVSVGY